MHYLHTRVTAPIDYGQHRENYRLRWNSETNRNNLDTRINLLINASPSKIFFFFSVISVFCLCVNAPPNGDPHSIVCWCFSRVQTHKVSSNGVREWPQGISRRRRRWQQNLRQHRTSRVVSGALLDTFSRCKILMFTFSFSVSCYSIEFVVWHGVLCRLNREHSLRTYFTN